MSLGYFIENYTDETTDKDELSSPVLKEVPVQDNEVIITSDTPISVDITLFDIIKVEYL